MNTRLLLTKAGFTIMLGVLRLPTALAEDPSPVILPVSLAAPTSGPQVAVFSIAMATSQSQQGTSASATVTVLDRAGLPVAGAHVTGSWSGLTASKGSALTNRQGRATFHSARSSDQGAFVFDIGSIAAAGASYNAALNAKSHESVNSIAANEVSHVSLNGK